ncbi:PP2C family protein-serine/threonine phosphatase, partial [Streptomyces scabiei]|uniref:PP2C family protein-serine/threonine phosphatase n=1 Tax=Streptomyces scabiei TaxID=1930 RepID=UPI0039F026B9
RWAVIASGTPLFLSSVGELAAHSPDVPELPAPSGHESWAFLPLTASGVTFGVCVLSFDRPRLPTDDERTLLTTITALVAQSLERAKLYDAEHTRSRELQRGLLPRGLPSVSACTAAARYLPAGQGMDVGGDWYDIIPLSGGQVALVVGDVMGRGLAAAATMGRLRTVARTLMALDIAPERLLARLDLAARDLEEDQVATCLCAVYDPCGGTFRIASAGHPPPLLTGPDGTVSFLEVPTGAPLGTGVIPYDPVERPVPERSRLTLYTDGLVRSRTADLGTQLERLREALRDGLPEDAAACRTVAERIGDDRSDDAIVLAALARPLDPECDVYVRTL